MTFEIAPRKWYKHYSTQWKSAVCFSSLKYWSCQCCHPIL